MHGEAGRQGEAGRHGEGRCQGEAGAHGEAGRHGEAVKGFDAIVLAGGRGSRLGDSGKPALVVGGRPLLAWVLAAAAGAGAGLAVVVGPPWPQAGAAPLPGGEALPDGELLAGREALPDGELLPGGVVSVREQPPGSGPVPALRRGLAEVTAPVVALLAADLPFLRPRHLRLLLAAGQSTGAVLADETGHPQWLAGCWQTAALRAALADYRGASLRGLLGPLEPTLLRYDLADGEPPPWLDCDTPEDVHRARRWLADGQLSADAPTGEEGSL